MLIMLQGVVEVKIVCDGGRRSDAEGERAQCNEPDKSHFSCSMTL